MVKSKYHCKFLIIINNYWFHKNDYYLIITFIQDEFEAILIFQRNFIYLLQELVKLIVILNSKHIISKFLQRKRTRFYIFRLVKNLVIIPFYVIYGYKFLIKEEFIKVIWWGRNEVIQIWNHRLLKRKNLKIFHFLLSKSWFKLFE